MFGIISIVETDSIIKNGDGWRERKLVLQCEAPQLLGTETKSEQSDFLTEVRLEELRPDYETGSSVGFDDLADWFAEHFCLHSLRNPNGLCR